MFFAPKPSNPSKGAKCGSLLDSKHKALRTAEGKLRKQKKQLELFLQKAPQLRDKQTRRRHEQIAFESRHRPNLVEYHGYDAQVRVNSTLGSRQLGVEKKNGIYLFLFLVAVLASVVIWIFRLMG